MKSFRLFTGVFLLALGIVSLSACGKNDQVGVGQNFVANSPNVDRTISENGVNYRVIGGEKLAKLIKAGTFLKAGSDEASFQLASMPSQVMVKANLTATQIPASKATDPLTVAIPVGVLNEETLFGAVITEVSDKESAELGDLKLTDLPPLHVRPLIAGADTKTPAIVFFGCDQNCDENSPREILSIDGVNPFALPIVAVDSQGQSVVVDVSTLSNDLNLIAMMDPDGEYTQLKTKTTLVKGVDYSVSTLIMDVQAQMIPLDADEKDPAAPVTLISTRWYLRLASAFNSAFTPRSATNGVGYFMTTRSKDDRITRWSSTSSGNTAPVHYYIKNVPKEFRAPFQASFDDWNTKMTAIIGHNIFSYEFVEADDPRAAYLVPGDVRYNILEWDLVNSADYGGLGPSIANQFTGETFNADVLIQGPHIVELYTKWFAAAKQAEQLKLNGHQELAEAVMNQFKKSVEPRKKNGDLKLSLGKIPFRVVARMPGYEDAAASDLFFDGTPEGYTFETYMPGYFQDMVSHELGHNLGLRHNFRGNMGASDNGEIGSVSRSVMEYLGRRFRYLDRIGEYDIMAISYGYMGKSPDHTDWYCTDEDAPAMPSAEDTGAAQRSAECVKDDATGDAYGYLDGRITKALDLLVARGSTKAPVWTVKDMMAELTAAVSDVGFYASSAATTGAKWTNFFNKPGRPSTVEEVPKFILDSLMKRLCDPTLDEVLSTKENDEGRAATLTNIQDFRTLVKATLNPLKVFAAKDLECVK